MTSLRVFAVLGSFFLAGLLFYLLEGVLTPFIIAWVASYLLVPVVDRLERHMTRWLAVLLVFIIFGALLGAIMRWIVPQVQHEVMLFMHQLPDTMHDIAKLVHTLANALHVPVASGKLASDLQSSLLNIGSHMMQGPSLFFSTAAQAIKVGIYVCLIPIVMFYLLRDWHGLNARIVSAVQGAFHIRLEAILETSNEVFRHFIHGQLLAMLGFGVLYSIGYLVSGISLGLVLGLMAGLLSAIPFAAFLLTGVPAMLLATVQFHGLSHLLMVMLTIMGAELVGNLVLIPVFVGRYVKVHAAAVLLLIFAGGALFGVMGMLMALPLAAIMAAYETHYGVFRARPAPGRFMSPQAPGSEEQDDDDGGQ